MTFWPSAFSFRCLVPSLLLAFHPPINLLTVHLLEIIDVPCWQYHAVWLTELLLYGPSHLPRHWCHLAESFRLKDAVYSCRLAHQHQHQHQTAPCSVKENTHTHTHTHTHSNSHLWFTGTLHRRNGFYTVKNCMCYCPTPTLHLDLALTGDCAFLLSPPKTHSVLYISILNYGDIGSVPINHLQIVIPMPLYTFVSS